MTQVSGRPDDLDEISDEELSAWYERLRRSAERALEEGWHGQPHTADPMPLSRLREELRHADYTAAEMREGLFDTGNNAHRNWHLTHPGQPHP
jgi:hypothetical protein